MIHSSIEAAAREAFGRLLIPTLPLPRWESLAPVAVVAMIIKQSMVVPFKVRKKFVDDHLAAHVDNPSLFFPANQLSSDSAQSTVAHIRQIKERLNA